MAFFDAIGRNLRASLDSSHDHAAMNERLTKVGPDAAASSCAVTGFDRAFAQLLENPVRRVRILGEISRCIATEQRLGLIAIAVCIARGSAVRIPDERGLRCPYHGWLFGATGACLERPLEAHPERRLRAAQGYPVQELGGMIFAYMGPLPAPALRAWDLYVAPNSIRQIAINVLDCNWLQCQENTGDPLHSVWTHGVCSSTCSNGTISSSAHKATTTRSIHACGWVSASKRSTPSARLRMRKGVIYSKELGADADR